MLDDFQNILNVSITIGEVLQNLLVAFLCGLLISVFYRLTYRGPGYSYSFLNSLIILVMIAAIVIMVIGNNLARAFGLVGAMSIIRFRTAIKDTQDIIFIFFALAIGMAAGVGLHALAFTGAITVGGVLYILNKTNAASPSKRDFLLQFSYDVNGGAEEALFLPVFEKFCKSTKLINTKTAGAGDVLELSYHVNLKNVKSTTEFIKELRNISGVNHVNLFFDEEYF